MSKPISATTAKLWSAIPENEPQKFSPGTSRDGASGDNTSPSVRLQLSRAATSTDLICLTVDFIAHREFFFEECVPA